MGLIIQYTNNTFALFQHESQRILPNPVHARSQPNHPHKVPCFWPFPLAKCPKKGRKRAKYANPLAERCTRPKFLSPPLPETSDLQLHSRVRIVAHHRVISSFFPFRPGAVVCAQFTRDAPTQCQMSLNA